MRGLRKTSADLDLCASKKLAKQIDLYYAPKDEKGFFVPFENCQMMDDFENFEFDIIDGYQCESLESILAFKKKALRPKDLKDIENIERYLETHKLPKKVNEISNPTKVIEYYGICHKLKTTIRTGWEKWGVQKERLESVAEHIYGTQMLALAMYSEYDYDVDIVKVIFMLAVHEIGEAAIGDFTPFEISREEKERLEHEAVHKILAGLESEKEIEQYFLEFDARETPEARFAYQCDKLDAELQCKFYDDHQCVDLNHLPHNEVANDSRVRKSLANADSWSEAFIDCDNQIVHYDSHFRQVSDYLKNSKH